MSMSAPTGAAVAPAPARGLGTQSAIRYASAGVAFLALAAIAVGCFLPAADDGSVTFERLRGNSLRETDIAWLTVPMCAVVALALARSLHRGERTLGPLLGGLVVMTEAVYIGAAELTTCPVGSPSFDGAMCQTAAPGVGLFVLAAGGSALAVAGLELARSLAPVPPEADVATEDDRDRVPAQLEPYTLHPSSELQYETLEQLQHALRARDGHVLHEAEFKGYYLYMTETVFVAAGRSQDHGFAMRDGEWVPFTPDTRPLDLEWILTLANAAEWEVQRAPTEAQRA
jgi:hypothetical protein